MVRRLVLSYLTLTLLVLAALEVPLGIIYARAETTAVSNTLERDAAVLAELAEEDIENADLHDLPALIASYTHRGGVHVTVVDRHGTVLAESATLSTTHPHNLRDNQDIATALHNHRTHGITRDFVLHGDAYYATAPAADGPVPRGAVRLTTATAGTLARIHAAWTVLAVSGLAVLGAVTALGFTLARWITRPVRDLERATAQLANGTLTQPPTADVGPPELRQLAVTFCRTAARLQHLLRAQHRFAADVSHQLKTPLTALRLRLENLEPHLHTHAHHHLEHAIREIDRLVQMVRGLLALARMENTEASPEPLNADAVMEDRAETWSAFASDRDVAIILTGPCVGHVWAVPGALEQILDNLLENALRAAPPGSTITLSRALKARSRDSPETAVELHVTDEGSGMTDDQLKHAFDRFWRAPNADESGTGLGLTIARQLAHASGGEIHLHTAAGQGLDAVIRLRPFTSGQKDRLHAPQRCGDQDQRLLRE
ncbi:MAG: HAMP domain-containing histidine kinase [Streptomycetaceae bacterium]|nr:HAMP domain-containing histidine kinase [Streptomycetaceae bacterium]